MSERLPYEESLDQQLNDLPLPDEDQSWQQMKQLLDEDDDDKTPPPVLLRGCLGWTLALVAVLAVLWLAVRPQRWWSRGGDTVQHTATRLHPGADTVTEGQGTDRSTGRGSIDGTSTKGSDDTAHRSADNGALPDRTQNATPDGRSTGGVRSSSSAGTGLSSTDGDASSTTKNDPRLTGGATRKPGGIHHRTTAPIPGSSEAARSVMPGARPPAAPGRKATEESHNVSSRLGRNNTDVISSTHDRDTDKHQGGGHTITKPRASKPSNTDLARTNPTRTARNQNQLPSSPAGSVNRGHRSTDISRDRSTNSNHNVRQASPVNGKPQTSPSTPPGNADPSNPSNPPVAVKNPPPVSAPAQPTSPSQPAKPATRTDTVVKKATAPVPTVATPAAKKPAENKPAAKTDPDNDKAHYYLSAGIGLQQQIPIAGQKAVPYNYYGRKGSLADYIPSVYFRLTRNRHTDRWFVQGEFRYGAPQSVKELTYTSVTRHDSGATVSIRNSATVKKTFYHQLPLSFNYYVLPNWSVGAGVMYSRFQGAVSEERTERLNQATGGDSILSNKIVKVPANTDSFFTHSQINALVQTEYTWRRFSISLRYTKGLQPFIRYTDPAGQPRQQRAQAFEALLRFRIWRSGKK